MQEKSPFVHRLPQSGWVLSSELAEAVDLTDDRVKDWLVEFKIPHKKLGTRWFVHMESFFQNLPHGNAEQPANGTTVLPAVGPFTDKEFANALGISVERVREWVLLHSLRGVKKMGTRVIIVDAEAFYASMPDFTQEPPRKSRPKKPR